MNASEFKAIGKALQVGANAAAAMLAACEAAGVQPTVRKKPGRKPKGTTTGRKGYKPATKTAEEDDE